MLSRLPRAVLSKSRLVRTDRTEFHLTRHVLLKYRLASPDLAEYEQNVVYRTGQLEKTVPVHQICRNNE